MKSAILNPLNFIFARSAFTMRRSIAALSLATILICAAPAFAQKNKTKQPPAGTPVPVVAMPDDKALEIKISEMLAAWQIGDADRLHTYYADDAVVVSGGWELPILGWTNYLASYQAQRAHMQGVHIDRTNTAVKVTGDSAWATYQWEFNGLVDNRPTTARGHTTLVFAKRDDHWLIVLNHTSVVQENPTAPAVKTGTP